MSHARPYASASVLVQRCREHIQAVLILPAHQEFAEEGLDGDERFRRAGNDQADQEAKRGADRYPTATPAETQDRKYNIKVAQAVCAIAAHILPLWPKLGLDGVGKIEKPPHAAKAAPPGHAGAWIQNTLAVHPLRNFVPFRC